MLKMLKMLKTWIFFRGLFWDFYGFSWFTAVVQQLYSGCTAVVQQLHSSCTTVVQPKEVFGSDELLNVRTLNCCTYVHKTRPAAVRCKPGGV